MIYYRYHPLRTQNLPVVRLYDFHDEVYYVVRQADGRPLAVPAWMTRPEAAHAKIISAARLPVRVLLELRRVTVTCFSARAHNGNEEENDAAAPSKMPTGTLRGTASRSRRTTPAGRACNGSRSFPPRFSRYFPSSFSSWRRPRYRRPGSAPEKSERPSGGLRV